MTNTDKSRSNANTALYAYIASKTLSGDLSGDDRENVTDLITELLHLVDTDRERFDGYDGCSVSSTAVDNYYVEHDGADDGTEYDVNADCPSLVSSEEHDARRSGAPDVSDYPDDEDPEDLRRSGALDPA